MSREVQFAVTCGVTRPGEHLRVVGSCQALGGWDPRKGHTLCTTATDFPVWKSERLACLDDSLIEYKYVVCNSAGQQVRWESTPNRQLHFAALAARGVCALVPDSEVTVTETFEAPQPPNSGVSQRTGSGGFPECAHPPSMEMAKQQPAEGLFQPTMRERIPSMAMLATPSMTGRSGSRSLLVELAPEVAMGNFESEDANENEEDPVELVGLVREESCSNLLLFQDFPEEPHVSPSFERMYTLLGDKPFGEGNFGLVWRCRSKRGGAERAAKIVRKARLHAREKELLLGEDGEVMTHVTLKHRHIVELFEYFDEAANVTLVLEYCPGGDLFDTIIRHSQTTGRGIPEHQALVASRHTLSALAYLHDLSIVHRDIKCENVLLSKVGVPLEQNVFKLCDFGFAAHDRGEGLRDRLGSPDTVAPEVVAGTCYSFPADLWSAGVVVYMMLSASPPFKAPTDAEVLLKVRQGRYSLSGSPWDTISAPPKHVITSLMIIEAKLRPTAVEALGKAWFQEQQGDTV